MTLTAQQYAALASDVYDEPRETGENSRTVDIGGAPYKRLEYVDRPSGYQGMIYRRVDTGELVVAHRGTEFERQLQQDGVSADGGMVAARHNNQSDDAIELTRHAMETAERLGKRDGHKPDVFVTGHSLGGNLAQVTAHHFGLRGETFNAYGAVSLDRRIPEGGTDVINHVMAGDAVSAASKHYGQVKVYATPHEVATLEQAGYANTASVLDARNPFVAIPLGDSHRIHNFLPVDGNGNPDRSVLEDPKAQQLAQQYSPMIDKYRDDVASMRLGATLGTRSMQAMTLADGIDQLRGPLASGAGRADMAAARWEEVRQRMQSEHAPTYVPPGWKIPLGPSDGEVDAPAAPRGRFGEPVSASVPNDPLYQAIHSKLPAGTSPAEAMHATVEAKRVGILRVDQLQSVTSHQDAVWIVGQTPGFRVKVDLSETVPPLQESIRQSQALDAQRSQPDIAQQSPMRAL
ncbi:hypothetical protein ALO95_03354 [Pseudomonas syringae pv. antirrhini]|uniref:DUF6792 domain-containing protein n=1 Tax=Pseudomonas syringae pv. antirrhini TaxID=251702 RepID=A0A0P9LEC9_9PSED|nr:MULTISPECIES: DUF6792 domain-containing protein [Pseudomonas]MCC4626377.1 hypothetical protein [Xanthomonas campestris pv. nigromaculans]KPW52079.1 Uncharacterized protein ALO88_02563 [Pseudomonas syringae pv. antirrhini]RMP36115.1 hypothetical protein ALQ24_00442 [Pseudomonas syringae pv. antirrhini]RMP39299.1 hypothetical protein ALQ23_00931 [Pseudomonas syringae pv. antirrhini]RMW23878.1 hypothetical protein ALO95_03354 [Pseudomonas syringae pv. antirrhini]